MKKYIIILTLLIVGCSKKTPINIDLLILSGDKTTFNTRDTNQHYSRPVFYLDEKDKVFLEGDLKNGMKIGNWIYWNKNGTKVEGLVSEIPESYSGKYIDF